MFFWAYLTVIVRLKCFASVKILEPFYSSSKALSVIINGETDGEESDVLMKNMTRNVLIGIGAAAAVGAAIALTSDKSLEKMENMVNRHKAKYFVKEKLHGNEKAMNVVNNLSDEEIRNLLSVVDKVTNLRGNMDHYSGQLKNMLMDKKEDAMDTIEKVKK